MKQLLVHIPLLHISTDFVFDGDKECAYEEDDAAKPLNVYGQSKLAGEMAVKETWEKHIILRTSWVYSEHGNNFVKTMLKLMHSRDHLQVVNDQWGCPTSARSIALALVAIAQSIVINGRQDWGIYHYCDSGKTNWYEFAKAIRSQAKDYAPLAVSISPICSDEWPSAATRPRNAVLSTEKIRRVFGIHPPLWQEQLRPVINALSS